MPTMSTFSGRKPDPMNIDAREICPEDIAHALSLLCRGGGHLLRFYSVGQHSLNCMKEAQARGWSRRVQFACLMHDASEAYLSDVIRPVKVHFPLYAEAERNAMARIRETFGLLDLNEEENRQWKQIDDDMLEYELKHLMPGESERKIPPLRSCPDLSERPWREVEAEFYEALRRFQDSL